MMNLWDVAILILAVTVMVVNLWNIFLTTKLMTKYEPLLDKSMNLCNKAMDWIAKQYEIDDEEDNEN